LRAIANDHFDHFDAASASSEHVPDLNAAISRAALEWIEE